MNISKEPMGPVIHGVHNTLCSTLQYTITNVVSSENRNQEGAWLCLKEVSFEVGFRTSRNLLNVYRSWALLAEEITCA